MKHFNNPLVLQQKYIDGELIFVFGSNLSGYHGKGAAADARKYWGAEMGTGIGPTGQAYAIPTKGRRIEFIPLAKVKPYVFDFVRYAAEHAHLTFQVTRIGCGLAGFKDVEIAPLFQGAPKNCWFDSEWKDILGDSYEYWGHVG